MYDTVVIYWVPEKTSYTGGVADIEGRVCIETARAGSEATTIYISKGSIGAGGDTEQVDVVDEVVSQALAYTGPVA